MNYGHQVQTTVHVVEVGSEVSKPLSQFYIIASESDLFSKKQIQGNSISSYHSPTYNSGICRVIKIMCMCYIKLKVTTPEVYVGQPVHFYFYQSGHIQM